MFIRSSFFRAGSRVRSATLAIRKSVVTFRYITDTWQSCPPSAFGQFLPVTSVSYWPISAVRDGQPKADIEISLENEVPIKVSDDLVSLKL